MSKLDEYLYEQSSSEFLIFSSEDPIAENFSKSLQAIWSLEILKSSILDHKCAENVCIACELKNLFAWNYDRKGILNISEFYRILINKFPTILAKITSSEMFYEIISCLIKCQAFQTDEIFTSNIRIERKCKCGAFRGKALFSNGIFCEDFKVKAFIKPICRYYTPLADFNGLYTLTSLSKICPMKEQFLEEKIKEFVKTI